MPQEYTLSEAKTYHSAPPSEQSTLHLCAREELTVTGVTGVDSFDDRQVQLCTADGALLIDGDGLHMDRLDLEHGEVRIRGRIAAMEYTDDPAKKEGLFSRLFR